MEGQSGHSASKSLRPLVLFVDDDAIVLKAMKTLIEKAGFDMIGCVTARDALSKAHASINAAVLDIHLPDESGLWLSQQIRAVAGPDLPIIILSGDNSMETIRALPDAGATYFFSKPVNVSKLIERVRELLNPNKL